MAGWPRPGSDCDRLLAALSDREWHSHRELYALGLMVHSRAADLRAHGYTLETRTDRDRFGDRAYMYRLAAVPQPDPTAPGPGYGNAAPDDDVPAQRRPAPASPFAGAGQLTLV